jgi:hypothetical protein
MPAQARSTNENATCVIANARRRRLVPGVIRAALPARPESGDPAADGRRGT